MGSEFGNLKLLSNLRKLIDLLSVDITDDREPYVSKPSTEGNQMKRLFLLASLLCLVVVLPGCRPKTVTPQAVFGEYHIRSMSATQQCLWIRTGEQQARLQLWQCTTPAFGYDYERFSLERVSPGTYTIHSVNHNNYCLGNASAGPQAPLEQNACTGATNQQWELRKYDDGYEIQNLGTGLCIDDWNDDASNGARVNQDNCTNPRKQRWDFISMGGWPAPVPFNTPTPIPPTPAPEPLTKRVCVHSTVESGWIITDWKKDGPPEKCTPDGDFKVWVLEKYAGRNVGTVIDACKGPVPDTTHWQQVDATLDMTRCGWTSAQGRRANTMRIRRYQ